MCTVFFNFPVWDVNVSELKNAVLSSEKDDNLLSLVYSLEAQNMTTNKQ